jgi:hypothetical protein
MQGVDYANVMKVGAVVGALCSPAGLTQASEESTISEGSQVGAYVGASVGGCLGAIFGAGFGVAKMAELKLIQKEDGPSLREGLNSVALSTLTCAVSASAVAASCGIFSGSVGSVLGQGSRMMSNVGAKTGTTLSDINQDQAIAFSRVTQAANDIIQFLQQGRVVAQG